MHYTSAENECGTDCKTLGGDIVSLPAADVTQ